MEHVVKHVVNIYMLLLYMTTCMLWMTTRRSSENEQNLLGRITNFTIQVQKISKVVSCYNTAAVSSRQL